MKERSRYKHSLKNFNLKFVVLKYCPYNDSDCVLHLRLIDFGLARELGGMDKVKCSKVGTLGFMAPEVDHDLILFKTKWTIFKACMILTLFSGDEVYLCKSCFRHVEFGGRPCLLDNQILELFHNWRTQVVLMMLVSGGISPFWAGTDIATQRRVVSDY